MARTIGVVTVARSDYGHLVPLLETLRDRPTSRSSSTSPARISPRASVAPSRPSRPTAGRSPSGSRRPVASDAPADVAVGGGRGRGRLRPRVRARTARPRRASWATASRCWARRWRPCPLALPVAHIHGGEVTEGAIDEQVRHAITKLAHLHFPAAEAYARRILQMGEEPWRVHCVGAPGLDRFARLAALPRAELARRIGLPLRRPTLLVTLPPGDARARRGGRPQRGAGRRARERRRATW